MTKLVSLARNNSQFGRAVSVLSCLIRQLGETVLFVIVGLRENFGSVNFILMLMYMYSM